MQLPPHGMRPVMTPIFRKEILLVDMKNVLRLLKLGFRLQSLMQKKTNFVLNIKTVKSFQFVFQEGGRNGKNQYIGISKLLFVNVCPVKF